MLGWSTRARRKCRCTTCRRFPQQTLLIADPSKRAGPPAVNAVVRAIVERQVPFSVERLKMELPFVNVFVCTNKCTAKCRPSYRSPEPADKLQVVGPEPAPSRFPRDSRHSTLHHDLMHYGGFVGVFTRALGRPPR